MRNILLALLVLLPAAARAACTKITMPTDFAAVTAGTRANLKANFTEIETRFDNCIDSLDEVRARLSGYSASLAITSLESLRLRIDSDGSSASSVVFEGTSSDTLAAVGEDSALYLPKLTASRLTYSNASKRLASVSDLTSWIAGTANQITATSDGDGTLTLSLPQNIHTGAGPTFASGTFSSSDNSVQTLSSMLNPNGGTGAIAKAIIGESSSLYLGLQYQGSGFTPTGSLVANQGLVYMPPASTGGLLFRLDANAPITFSPNNTQAMQIAGSGAVTMASTLSRDGDDIFTAATHSFRANTSDGSDTKRLLLAGGGNAGSVSRGAFLGLYGNEFSGDAGDVILAGGEAGDVRLSTGAGQTDRLSINSSGTATFSGPLVASSTLGVTGVATFNADPVFNSVNASQTLEVNGSKALTSVAQTGTGSYVKNTSPTLVTPSLGVATATSIALGGNEAFTYDEGSFTVTLTGVAESVTGTAYYTRVGKAVTLKLPVLYGTSNTSSMTVTGIDASIIPTNITQLNGCNISDAGTLYYDDNISTGSNCQINGGTISCFLNGNYSGFTSSGLKGFGTNGSVSVSCVTSYTLQ